MTHPQESGLPPVGMAIGRITNKHTNKQCPGKYSLFFFQRPRKLILREIERVFFSRQQTISTKTPFSSWRTQCPMASYRFPVVCLLFSHGFPLVFRWFGYGFHVVFLWFSYCFPMIFLRFSFGFPMVGLPMGTGPTGDRSYRQPVPTGMSVFLLKVVFSLFFTTLLKKVANRVDETQVFRYEKSHKPRRRDASFYKML